MVKVGDNVRCKLTGATGIVAGLYTKINGITTGVDYDIIKQENVKTFTQNIKAIVKIN